VCVLTARAFSLLYDLKLTIRGEMEYAYQGEILTPSQCGRMDQGCAYGSRPILMTYDGEHLDVEEMTVPPGTSLHYVLVDLEGEKSTTLILQGLQAGYPDPKTDIDKGCALICTSAPHRTPLTCSLSSLCALIYASHPPTHSILITCSTPQYEPLPPFSSQFVIALVSPSSPLLS
jgi:hypothetical protein